MYGIVVIEDDNIIRKGIITMLGRLDLPCQVIGEASDGEAGLKLICEKKPEIVITDIKMPLLDGVEMIIQAIQQGVKSKILVISGFDDYHFVRNAMKNGAVDYLLKPISRSLLEKSISQVIAMMEEECRRETYLNEIHQQLKSTTKDIQELKLEKLLAGDCNADTESDKIQTVLRSGCDYSVAIIENNQENIIKDNLLYQRILNEIKNEVYEFCMLNQMLPVIARYKRQIVVIANHGNHMEMECFYQEMLCFLGGKGRNVSVSTSSLGTHLHQLKEYYDQAYQASAFKIYTDRMQKQLSYLNIPNNAAVMAQVKGEVNSKIYQLVNQIELGDKKQVLAGTDGLLNMMYDKHISSGSILEAMENLVNAVDKMVVDLTNYPKENSQDIRSLESIYNFNMYKQWCRKQVEDRLEFIEHTRQERNKKIVEQVRQYIHKHYAEPVNLTDLAEYVNLSPNYLSEVFRKEVGQTFIKYLINYRMQEAKYLLQNTDYKIYQIAEMVGYHEVISFNRAFKNTVGISPKEYANCVK